ARGERPARRRGALVAVTALAALGAAALLLSRRAPPPTPAPLAVAPTPPPSTSPPRGAVRLATIASLGTSALRHGASVTALAVLPDEPVIVAADAFGVVRWWRAADGAELATVAPREAGR